ncbi:hypothetical protein [Streptomyces sp. NPDC056527]|uniref:hypothetical protein n=1 Tax=Streptomyces sp. NPDC056527 TaxID=3345853 RepID=UPI0036AB1586
MEHDEDLDARLDCELRHGTAALDRALRRHLDVESALLRVKGGRREVAGSPTDGRLREVLAAWSAELGVAVRGAGRVIRPVADDALFAALTGRGREGVEAWPETQVTLSGEAPWVITVSLSLPGRPPADVRVVVEIGGADWWLSTTLEPLGDSPASDEVTELVGTVTVDGEEPLSLQDVRLALRAERS